MNKKLIIALIILTVLIISSIYLVSKSNQKKIIIVGTEAPPHTFTKNGTLDGITIKLAGIIFNKLGVDYEIKLIQWGDAINEMKQGKADVIMDAIPTRERMRFLNINEDELYFNSKEGIDTRWSEEVVAAYKKDSKINISKKEDLDKKDYRIGIINGYFYLGFDFYKYNVYSYRDSTALINGVNDGEVDIAIVSKLEGEGVIKNYNLDNIQLSKGLFKSHYLKHFSFSIVKNKKYLSKLKEKVENEIIEMKKTGEYQKIYNKYLDQLK